MDPKERRASSRQPIKLAAQLVLGDDDLWPCQIADFNAEGLFIRYSGDTARRLDGRLMKDPGQPVGVRFRTPDGQTRHELKVSVVRKINGAMGVMFTESNPDAVAAMLAQCGAEGGHERSALKPPSEKVQFVLHQCARTLIQHIEPLMDACFVRMMEALKEAALKASSDQQANDYMDTSGQLQIRQRAIWHQMLQALESPLKPARKGAPASELSLVDKSEFEDWLTVKVMVTKADTLYRGPLLMLKMRLDRLQVGNATGYQNPMGPALICEAFHSGLQQLKASRPAEKVCLKTFEISVLNGLGPLYESLNQILIRQGVLPDLDLSKYLSEHKPKAEQTLTPAEPAPEPAEPPSRPEGPAQQPAQSPPPAGAAQARRSPSETGFRAHAMAAQSAFATVRNLIGTLSASRLSRGDTGSIEFPADARPLSAGEFQRELQSLQAEPVDPVDSPAALRERVVERIRASGNNALDDEQQGTLDVVDRFFNSVVESPKLAESAREQMRKLEVPVLKVVLRDQGFFEDRDSPVRGVMDRLAQLGVKGGKVNPVIQRKMDELIQRIINDFEQDTRVFEHAQQELDALIDRQNLVFRRNVERVTAAAEGAQKVSESKAAVSEAIDQRLAGRRVPQAVVSLLNNGWRDLLSLTWIRQGPDSELWQQYLAVMDSLLALGEDPNTRVNLPELLRIIQDGLSSISSNHMPASQIRDELKQFLVRRPDTPTQWVDMPAANADRVEPDVEEKRNERQQRSIERWISRARKLRTGDWLRDQKNPREPQYIRLVWVARGFGRFVFVNHQGMRVVELELEALARQMKDGLIVPDSQYERPLVDESIDRMVQKVYDQLSWSSTHDELTGLLARREFERMLEQQLARHEDERTLVRLDLRQFRTLNDRAGYAAGDEVIRKVADILREHVGDGMPLSRLAGTEFAFLLPSEQAESATAAIMSAIEAWNPVFDEQTYRLAANAGLAEMLPVLATAERWLKAADEACKAARGEGDAAQRHYRLDESARAQQAQVQAKVEGLDDLDRERVLLSVQKMIPLHAEVALGTQYEVQLSMYDDAGELIGGPELARMAERYQRMETIERWLVGYMLDWLRDKAPDEEHMGGLFIQLSGHSLNDETLLEFIYDRLSQQQAPIERLWFEITEAAAIADLQSVSEFMEEMKELGCRFCLANFGSGPTSYQYMRSLPVDLIKLDDAFSHQINRNQDDQAMVRSMVDMAHYMKREVIACDVESRDALDMLKSLGVDYAQGSVVAKPQLLTSLE